MLCGLLLSADVLRISAVFASSLLHALRFLRLHWPQLCHDLSTGTLNPAVVTDPSVCEAVGELLDQNRLLINKINQKHKSRIPDNISRNVGLIRELNSNIRRVVDLYADLSTSLGRSVAASSEGDSIGTLKSGCKGVDSPVFDELEAVLAQDMLSLPATKEI
ncbi:Protein ELF4-LIKE 4 [Ananas comosus]|uniref:Protein ELF4-LIKE 4 n=1 Tax=Ananas comosus TaxID=4615 RepID=A0A199VRA2_ANACO|nr:Protein ELF4-LIKE 4 [Ananas comosus]